MTERAAPGGLPCAALPAAAATTAPKLKQPKRGTPSTGSARPPSILHLRRYTPTLGPSIVTSTRPPGHRAASFSQANDEQLWRSKEKTHVPVGVAPAAAASYNETLWIIGFPSWNKGSTLPQR
ncbi:unnamed protein product [Urochloa humidicola]